MNNFPPLVFFWQTTSDRGVIALAENCVMIKYLCLSNCTDLTDASLVVLSQHCVHLETLEVSSCSQFTDNGFQALARVSWPCFLPFLVSATVILITVIIFSISSSLCSLYFYLPFCCCCFSSSYMFSTFFFPFLYLIIIFVIVLITSPIFMLNSSYISLCHIILLYCYFISTRRNLFINTTVFLVVEPYQTVTILVEML